MSESWKQWEGQIVSARYLLQRYLGGSEHSAVFLTTRGTPPQKVAIKFTQVDESDAQLQLSRWQHAAKLSHPHLLRTFDSGRCRLGDFDLLYVVMEYAEENLSQFLTQRPLTPVETRDVLSPALEALAFLHGEGLIHGHVRPSNILAIEDQLKLSSDGISSLSEHADDQSNPPAAITQPSLPAASLRHPSPYDAPEIAKGIISPAGDIWSLGITLVEALTQHLPATTSAVPTELVVPDTLPALFLDIVRHCLQRDPQRRWTVVEIAARLNPGSVAPSVSAATPAPASATSSAHVAIAVAPALISASPQEPATASSVNAKSEPTHPIPSPASRLPVHTQTVVARGKATRPRYDLVQPHLQRPPLLPPLPKFNYLPLGIVAALVLTAIFLGPRLLHRRAPVQQVASVAPQEKPAATPIPAAAKPKNISKSAQKPAQSSVPPSSPRTSQTPPQTSPQKASDARTSDARTLASAIATPAPAPAALTSVANPPRVDSTPKPAAGSVAQGEVLNQVLPEVSSGALATIRGTVRVTVKLHVDSAGNISSAELFSPGPSKYFADQALQAAHRWDFAPAKVDGHAVASDWLVRFEFTPSITKVHPTQSTP